MLMHTSFKRIVIFLLPIAILASCRYSQEQEAMRRLERAMLQKDQYEQQFLQRVDQLKNELRLSTDNGQKWSAAEKLFTEYLSYDIDSAFAYSAKMGSLASSPEEKVIASGSQVSYLCALRLYPSAEKLLCSIDTSGFNDIQYKAYYNAHIALYTALGNEFATDDAKAGRNIRNRHTYQAQLLGLPTLTARERTYIHGKQLMLEEHYDEALTALLTVLDMDSNVASRLHTTYAIANCYKAKGERSNYKRWLAETAILDFQRPNRQYRSLYDLALCLYEDGDYRKAGKFIQVTMTDAIACKHDTRIINAAAAQTIINAAMEVNAKRENRLLVAFSILALIAIVVISAALAKVNSQRKRLKALIKQTKNYNHELSRKNNIISEANLLKEKYMFKYMYLSANFIKEMDEYRRDLRHTYKNNGIDALMAKLREPEYMYMQYKSFYKLFDEIFLGIFPDFPDRVNSMLKEDKQIKIKNKDTLPTELRILAVIRLGIAESRKIAEFLNTSVNTIYTYRTKMRYDSIAGPDKFEENVKNIDYIKL